MTPNTKIKKVLIANRGEIARRIIRACRGLGIDTVLVVSDPDRNSLAASEATQVMPLGGASARESYLDIEKIVRAARESGADAVHPGYGFLSEDADFAQRVIDAGLIFVGPSPASIRALGVKTTARQTVSQAGVPITPGSAGGLSDHDIADEAVRIGFPVIIKAAAGGGGRGMRIVRERSDMPEALERARAEALKNFGSHEVYCEKFVEEPRHVEVQLFGDHHGNVVHLGTRDCSAQRRHQKLVEEAPAPFLSQETRRKIHDAAVIAAKSVGYHNAGTAEFLVKGDDFYFLEINTRIQVEHPVTEAVTGLDLVQLQLKVAMGEPLPFQQDDVSFTGHAIEFRINAEDVYEHFRPATGTITGWKRPEPFQVEGQEIREEYGYRSGDTIPPYYDSLISKVIVHAPSRREALFSAFQIFKGYSITGVPTTVPFHVWILSRPEFATDGIDIGFVERVCTAVEIEQAQSLLPTDPLHVKPDQCGALHTERVVMPLPSGALITVDIVHEEGGTFLAIPLSAEGSPSAQAAWCRSNVRSEALKHAVSLARKLDSLTPVENVLS